MTPERRQEYEAYLASKTWAGKRQAALEAAGRRCQVCNRRGRLDVHHRTYERFGGKELPGDLTVLCRRCHSLFHEAKAAGHRRQPATAPQASQQHRCQGCGRGGLTKNVYCKKCRKAQRKGRKAKRAKPPLPVTQEDIHRFADAMSHRWRPVQTAGERRAIVNRNRADAKQRRLDAPKPSQRDLDRYGGYLAKQAAKSRSATERRDGQPT